MFHRSRLLSFNLNRRKKIDQARLLSPSAGGCLPRRGQRPRLQGSTTSSTTDVITIKGEPLHSGWTQAVDQAGQHRQPWQTAGSGKGFKKKKKKKKRKKQKKKNDNDNNNNNKLVSQLVS